MIGKTNRITYRTVLTGADGKKANVEKTGRSVIFEIDGVKIGMAIQDADRDDLYGRRRLVHVASGLIIGDPLDDLIDAEKVRTGHAPSVTDAATITFERALEKHGSAKMLSVIRGAKVINVPPKGRI